MDRWGAMDWSLSLARGGGEMSRVESDWQLTEGISQEKKIAFSSINEVKTTCIKPYARETQFGG